MSEARKHIDQFNRLKGQAVTGSQLKRFINQVKGVPGCEGVHKRLETALKAMGNHQKIRLQFEPISLPVEPRPARTRTTGRRNQNKRSSLKATREVKPKKVKALGEVKPKAPAKVAKNKPGKIKRLRGLVSGKEIAEMQFEPIPLSGKYKNDFVAMNNDTQILIWGLPGAGKTVYIMEFSVYLASLGKRVLFIAKEEMNRSTLTLKCRKHNIHHPNLLFIYDFDELKAEGKSLDDFDVIVYDSIQVLGLKLADYQKLVRDYPGKIHIPVVQTTKAGTFKGGQDWPHEVDQAGYVHNFRLTLTKNRLDPDNAAKMEAAEFNNQVEELKVKKQIREQVKQQIQAI